VRLGDSLERRRGRRRFRPSDHPDGHGRSVRVSRGILLTGGALVVFGWLFGYLLSTRVLFPAPPPPGDLLEVPDLRGLTLATAGERVAGSRLALGPLDSLQHPSVANGLIVGQSPLPGQLARAGSPVRLTVSLGPQRRAVPDVVRIDADRARIVLETSGFLVSTESIESELPRGRVVEISPPPDSVVALPARVLIRVSTGPPLINMPLVLGMEEQDARALLDSIGFVVAEVEEVFRYGRDQGIVVEQEPASETALRRGSPVHLKVGRRGLGRGNDDREQ
jgi:eukaryotic-like serine/threonine-protein kinase